MPAGAASREGMSPSASLASRTAPRLDPSGSADGVTATPSASAMIRLQAGEASSAAPVPTTVPSPGQASRSRSWIIAKRYATVSRAARTMSTGRVASERPTTAARAPATQPRLRSPARNGSIVRPWASGSIAWSISSTRSSGGRSRVSVSHA